MSIIDDLLGKEPEQRTVEFCLDRDLRTRLAETQYELEQAKRRAASRTATDADRDTVADLEYQVEQLIPDVRARLVRFVFNAIPTDAYDALKGQHRPTEAQKTEARKAGLPVPDVNTRTFPPALIAAACTRVETPSATAPGLTVEEAEQLWASDAYNQAERNELFNTALEATVRRIQVDLPKGA